MTCLRKALAICAGLILAACGGGDEGGSPGGGPSPPQASKVGHVFIIVLENHDYEDSFAPDTLAPYLAQTLPAQGALLQNYYGTAHVSLGNYIAMISGQGANPVTQGDCLVFLEFQRLPIDGPDGQALGTGCVYPTSVPNVVDQLKAKGLTWKAYMEDMGFDPERESATCAHPPLNGPDPTQVASEQDQYATRHNPFVYFRSIIDDQADCDANVVNLNEIHDDLASVVTTANYSFISPNLCHDGHDAPCVNGEPGGLESINAFLQTYVPIILDSPAFKQDGLLIVTFDESGGPHSDSSGCCGAAPTLNTPLPGITGLGGGRVGAVLISPFIQPGTVSTADYNHYSMLRSVQDLFGLPYLGYAGSSAVTSFGADVFTRQMPELPAKNQ